MKGSVAEVVFEGVRRVIMGLLSWILLASGIRRTAASRTYRQGSQNVHLCGDRCHGRNLQPFGIGRLRPGPDWYEQRRIKIL